MARDPCSSNDREGETLIERETTFSGRMSRLRNRYACDLLSHRVTGIVDRETRNAMKRYYRIN